MSVDQEAEERYEKARDLLMGKNERAKGAVVSNNVSKMEKIFKTGGIKQDAIDHLIFEVRSVGMMKLFILNGGDIHKQGPPLYPNPRNLLLDFTSSLDDHAADSFERRESVKLIEFMIEEGADVNAASEKGGFTPFITCARNGERELCKYLVDRGADLSAKRNDGITALHLSAQNGYTDVCRYLVKDCGLDINAESQDKDLRQRTPLYLAARNGQIEVCEYLLAQGASVDAGDQPLIEAAQV
jgi:hypothetical protein